MCNNTVCSSKGSVPQVNIRADEGECNGYMLGGETKGGANGSRVSVGGAGSSVRVPDTNGDPCMNREGPGGETLRRGCRTRRLPSHFADFKLS